MNNIKLNSILNAQTPLPTQMQYSRAQLQQSSVYKHHYQHLCKYYAICNTTSKFIYLKYPSLFLKFYDDVARKAEIEDAKVNNWHTKIIKFKKDMNNYDCHTHTLNIYGVKNV